MPADLLNRQISSKRIRKFSRPGAPCQRWAVILAGGDGTRLRSMTRAIAGDDRPKQFVPIIGGSTLLDQTRDRVALSVSPGQTLLVVTEKHKRFYQPLTETLPKELLVAQPCNKGTAPAIVYALMRVAVRSPKAIVGLFPSDHFFADDQAFMSHVDAAYESARNRPNTVTLLGITPETPESEYGWIEPHGSILSSLPGSITRVRRFWEKPTPTLAQSLMEHGCLWNSFVMVGRVDSLLRMTQQALPKLFATFAGVAPALNSATEHAAIGDIYARIAESNFSHEVLATRAGDLAVMRVGEVGWSDLGEPKRVLSALARLGEQTMWIQAAS